MNTQNVSHFCVKCGSHNVTVHANGTFTFAQHPSKLGIMRETIIDYVIAQIIYIWCDDCGCQTFVNESAKNTFSK